MPIHKQYIHKRLIRKILANKFVIKISQKLSISKLLNNLFIRDIRLRQVIKSTDKIHSLNTILYRHPGHFYSPLPDLKYVADNQKYIFSNYNSIPGININEDTQLAHLDYFKSFYDELDFPNYQTKTHRYYYMNNSFSYGDAIILFSMLRYYKPAQIIEIGSGFSSALMLDTSEKFLQPKPSITFIEPYPDKLKYLLGNKDVVNTSLIESLVQSVDVNYFSKLVSGDILFIDSSHVAKTGSDLNHILFKILPLISEGVIIHFHDIFWPFEYPESWILEGRAWNEIYLLRAFLSHNTDYEILYFNSYMFNKHRKKLEDTLPLCINNCGGSIWLRKLKR